MSVKDSELSQNKPYIAIGLSFFEDVFNIEKTLDSVLGNRELLPYVKVLAIDGVYKGYPNDHKLSEDGSREIIEQYITKYPLHIELYDYPNLHERFKRQKYVDIAAKQHIPWLLILDSDEWVDIKKGRVEKFIRELKKIADEWYDTNIENPLPMQRVGNVCQVSCIDVQDTDTGVPPYFQMLRPRLWYRPQDVVYTTKHYWFKRRDDITPESENYRQDNIGVIANSKYRSVIVNNITIWHSHEGRTEDRETRRRVYEFERLPKLEGKPKLGIFDKENIKQ